LDGLAVRCHVSDVRTGEILADEAEMVQLYEIAIYIVTRYVEDSARWGRPQGRSSFERGAAYVGVEAPTT
jgi:hypothetical protein